MNKKFFSLAIAAGLVVTNIPSSYAAQAISSLSVEKSLSGEKTESGAYLVSNKETVNYSDFLKDGGGYQEVRLDLKGAKFTTTDPKVAAAAITQNYDIETTFGLGVNGTTMLCGVYSPNQGIEYIDNWEITIDSSVLDIDEDLTIKIPVINDINAAVTPKIVADKTSVTREELINGFDITLEAINGADFNTSCLANEVRVSIVKTANISVEALPYCNAISSKKIKFHIKALNGVPSHLDRFEFRVEGDATNSSVPLMVKLDLEQGEANVADKTELKAAIDKALSLNASDYTKESYDYLLAKLEVAQQIMDTNVSEQSQIDRATLQLNSAIDRLVKAENVNQAPVLNGVEDVTINVGEAFNLFAGITAADEEDGKITNIKVSGILDVHTPGQYTLTYSVTDSEGLTTTSTRVVTVVGSVQAPEEDVNESPVFYGVEDVTITVGEQFDRLAGVTAIDKEDGDLTADISVRGTVNTSKAGEYKVRYLVGDFQGNTTTAERIVTVVEAPVVEEPSETQSGNEFNSSTIYYGGEVVSYNGEEYKAKWWTQGETPDKSPAWEKIITVNNDGSIAWNEGMVCVGGDIVTYNGKTYEAKWWTSSTPGSDDSWKVIN